MRATAADRRALQQVHERVLSIANGNAQKYEPLSAATHPEVAASEALIAAMDEQDRTQQLLLPLRALLEGLPATAQSTKEHREALQEELSRVMSTANRSEDYASISADTHPEVATCEKAIKDMLSHEEKAREDELQRQREEAQARTEKLLSELRAVREKVRMCADVCLCILYVYICVFLFLIYKTAIRTSIPTCLHPRTRSRQ